MTDTRIVLEEATWQWQPETGIFTLDLSWDPEVPTQDERVLRVAQRPRREDGSPGLWALTLWNDSQMELLGEWEDVNPVLWVGWQNRREYDRPVREASPI